MMTLAPAEVVVILGALAAIAWVNWYFLFSGREPVAAAHGVSGVQEIRVRVEGGYVPASVRVSAGRPVRMVFDRQERSGCSEELVMPAFGVKRFLPPFEETVVEFTPREAGTFEFTCGMGMLRGRVIVDEEGAE